MDSLSIYFLIWLVMGLVCARVARSRGRSIGVWFVLGVLFSFIALLALWILPSKVNTGDQSLSTQKPSDAPQVSTVAITAPGNSTLSIQDTPSTKSTSNASSTYWHYINSKKETLGPLSFSSLQEKWHAGEISISTYVWNESMESWKKIEDMPEIAPFFGKDSII